MQGDLFLLQKLYRLNSVNSGLKKKKNTCRKLSHLVRNRIENLEIAFSFLFSFEIGIKLTHSV